jgi:hypothetical protein
MKECVRATFLGCACTCVWAFDSMGGCECGCGVLMIGSVAEKRGSARGRGGKSKGRSMGTDGKGDCDGMCCVWGRM